MKARLALVMLMLATAGAWADEASRAGKPVLNAEICAAQGGTWLDGVELCVFLTYEDAGKPCTDKADCQGKCLALNIHTLPPATGPETGACAKDSKLLGCKAEILKGVRQPVICRD